MQSISTTLLILGNQHSLPIKRLLILFTTSPLQPPFYSLFSKFEDSLSHTYTALCLPNLWTLSLKLSPPVGHCEECYQYYEHGYANTYSSPCFQIIKVYTHDPHSPSPQVVPMMTQVWGPLLCSIGVTLLSWPHLTIGTALKLWIPVFSTDKQSMFLKISILGQSEHVGVSVLKKEVPRGRPELEWLSLFLGTWGWMQMGNLG